MAEPQYRIWWVPQIPMQSFEIDVPKGMEPISTAKLLLSALADYDLFQYENNIKPDYSNAGGLMILENDVWCEWCDEDGYGIDDYIQGNVE